MPFWALVLERPAGLVAEATPDPMTDPALAAPTETGRLEVASRRTFLQGWRL
jgi:hypothetical protein